jgi:hypothetical protein
MVCLENREYCKRVEFIRCVESYCVYNLFFYLRINIQKIIYIQQKMGFDFFFFCSVGVTPACRQTGIGKKRIDNELTNLMILIFWCLFQPKTKYRNSTS